MTGAVGRFAGQTSGRFVGHAGLGLGMHSAGAAYALCKDIKDPKERKQCQRDAFSKKAFTEKDFATIAAFAAKHAILEVAHKRIKKAAQKSLEKPIEKAATAQGTKIAANQAAKLAATTTAKTGARGALATAGKAVGKMFVKLAAGPLGWILLITDLSFMVLDMIDPANFNKTLYLKDLTELRQAFLKMNREQINKDKDVKEMSKLLGKKLTFPLEAYPQYPELDPLTFQYKDPDMGVEFFKYQLEYLKSKGYEVALQTGDELIPADLTPEEEAALQQAQDYIEMKRELDALEDELLASEFAEAESGETFKKLKAEEKQRQQRKNIMIGVGVVVLIFIIIMMFVLIK